MTHKSHFLKKIAVELSWALFVVVRKIKSKLFFIKRLLVKPQLPKNQDGKIFIHLGCGDINSPEFINVDARPAPHIHYVRDVTDLSIFPENYAHLVYACHLLEHIHRDKLKQTLWEWRRILKKGGILRLSVPDFDKLINIYRACNNDISIISRALMGGQGYESNFHYSVFNLKYLSHLLTEVGFRSVREWNPHTFEHHNYDDYASYAIVANGENYPVSLNVEAVKQAD